MGSPYPLEWADKKIELQGDIPFSRFQGGSKLGGKFFCMSFLAVSDYKFSYFCPMYPCMREVRRLEMFYFCLPDFHRALPCVLSFLRIFVFKMLEWKYGAGLDEHVVRPPTQFEVTEIVWLYTKSYKIKRQT